GLYTWLPLGVRTLRKIERIVREEMNRAGAQEVLMPAVQPAELWEESGRWVQYGPELLRLHDRHDRAFCVGPTHEEVITDLARREIRSYRQLPLNLYQIQTKFRDEIRPRFGVMRSREFIMKDAYSFDINQPGVEASYAAMHDAYVRIFTRCGVDFRVVDADSGSIGGSRSQEFHVLANSGEDVIAFSEGGHYAANLELAPTFAATISRPAPSAALATVDTPDQHTIADLAGFLNVDPAQCMKTLLLEGADGSPVAVVMRGDHELNEIKAAKRPELRSPTVLADAETVRRVTGADPGSIGPVGLDIPILADFAALQLSDFICGANESGKHLTGVNWERDLPEAIPVDVRNVVAGDPSPNDDGPLRLARGIEVGHIFQLGTKYSEAMNATCLDENGKNVTLIMGCYGIGVTRVAAASIEQHHDEQGIIWPAPIAPFEVALLPMNMHKSQRLRDEVEAIYRELHDAGIDVLLDDRQVRPGVMFAEMELIGIPYRIVVGERGLDKNTVEFKSRASGEEAVVSRNELCDFLRQRITANE
ncbi:MAG: proline--tRNA ligase, partial [Pseudomonadota bacterium]